MMGERVVNKNKVFFGGGFSFRFLKEEKAGGNGKQVGEANR